MSEENESVALKITLDTADAATSIKDIRKSLKDLQSAALEFGEGSEGFELVTHKAGELKDKIEDLNQSINARKGEGFEKFGGQLSVLGDKLKNLDFKGANTAIAAISNNFKGIGFKEVIDGVKGFGSVLLNLGKAILANPIFLIAAVLIGIGAAIYALKDKVKIISKVFEAFGAVLDSVIQLFKDLGDALGLTNFAIEENAEKTIEAAKKTGEAISAKYEDEIKLAKAAGKTTFDLEIQKQNAIIDSARVQVNALKSIYLANGTLTEEQTKQLEALVKTIHTAQVDIQAQTLQHTRETNEELDKKNKEYSEKAKAQRDKAAEEIKKHTERLISESQKLREDEELRLAESDSERLLIIKSRQAEELKGEYDKSSKTLEAQNALHTALLALENKYNADLSVLTAKAEADKTEQRNKTLIAEAELKVDQDKTDTQAKIDLLTVRRDIELEDTTITAEQKLLIHQRYFNSVDELRKADEEKEKAKKEREKADTFAFGQSSLSALGALSDALFTIKRNNLTKGSAEELKAAKKQFDINKGIALGAATLTGIQSVMSAFANGMKNPIPLLGPATAAVYAITAGVAAAANIAKIASTKFEGGGSAASVTPASTPAPSLPSPAAQVETKAAPRMNDYSLFGTAGKANNFGTGTNGSNNTGTPSASEPIRAYITESEVTSVQNRNSSYKAASQI